MAIVRTPVTAALLAGACFAQSDYLAYVGGYGPGINAFRFHAANGRMTHIGLAVETPASSFLVVHPNGHYLYAVNENGKNDDTVSAFAIDAKSGKLTLLNSIHSRGSSPCHLSLDKTSRFLAVANYGSGSVAVLPVMSDGRLGEVSGFDQQHGSSVNHERQTGPHAHCVVFSPDNRFLLAADLGTDKVMIYRFDAASGKIAPNDPPEFSVAPGSGPRHLEFHPNGRFVYLINEMASTVELLHYDSAKGALDSGQTVSMLPEGFKAANTAAEIAVNGAGSVLYASNRGHNSLALFHIDAERGGMLSFMEHASTLGKTPRFFTFDPTGQYLLVANQDSDDLVVFSVHPKTGELRPTGPIEGKLPQAACIVFVR
jgi:6-phosphogluconolactonase